MILGGCTLQQAESRFGQRMREALQAQEPDISLSIGYAEAGHEDLTGAEELLQQADASMYASKRRRRDGSS